MSQLCISSLEYSDFGEYAEELVRKAGRKSKGGGVSEKVSVEAGVKNRNVEYH